MGKGEGRGEGRGGCGVCEVRTTLRELLGLDSGLCILCPGSSESPLL